MAVTPDQVRLVAELARLRLDPSELDALTGELNGILEHMAALRDAPAADPSSPVDDRAGAPLRPDAPPPDALGATPDRIAPAWAGGFFIVPRLSSHGDRDEGGADRVADAP